MKNIDKWKPTKFSYRNGKLRGSLNTKELYIGSRLGGNISGEFYQNAFKEYAKGTLLDLGCGKVPFYMAYVDYVDEIICADWGNSEHGISHIDFTQDLTQKIKLSDNSVDTVLLSDVLEHLKKPEDTIKEIYRILKPNGVLIMNTPFFYWIHEAPYDYYRYTEFALKELLEEADFRIEILKPSAGILEVLSDIFSKFIMVLPILGPILAALIQCFSWIWFKFPLGAWYAEKSGKKFPYGYQIVAFKE